ncbi:MAG: tetratricopeptide (TPR) repeat protein [Planctomycetota bacterium]|jgi:tetratricopeptide (TPR) repeat protein
MCVPNRNTRRFSSASAILGLLLLAPLGGSTLVSCQGSGGPASTASISEPRRELQTQIDDADELFGQQEFDDARQRYEAIYLAAEARGYDGEATEAAAQCSASLSMLNRLDDAELWLERAEEKAEPSAERSWSRVLLARGMQRLKNRDLLTARRTFIELYNFCFLNSLTPRAIQAATLASESSQGQEQLDWSMRAIQAASTTGNVQWQAPLWSSHAWLLNDRGRAEEALEAFKKARDLTGRADISRLGRIQADWAYGHGLRVSGQLEEARDLLEETNAIAHSIYIGKPSARAAKSLGQVLWEIGEIDAMEGKKERAREHLLAARSKMLEAGPAEGAPALVEELDARLEALDAPVPVRRFPPDFGNKKKQ